MKKIYRLKAFFLIYVLIQTIFMVTYTPMTGKFDLFPLFTWNIFRPYPKKYLKQKVLVVKAINGFLLEKPSRIVDLPSSLFPHVNEFDFSYKVERLGDAIIDGKEKRRNQLLRQVRRVLLEGNDSVKFCILKRVVEPIEFYKTGRFLSEEVIYEAIVQKRDQRGGND